MIIMTTTMTTMTTMTTTRGRQATRPAVAMVLGLLLAACGASHTEIVPTLPGDGNSNTARPTRPTTTSTAPSDPWAGRDDLLSAPAPVPPRAVDLPPISRFTLPSGLPVIAIRSTDLPVVSVQLAIKAGQADASRDKEGLAEFAALMLRRGTRQRTAAQISDALEYAAGSLDVDTSHAATLLTCAALKNSLATCLTLLSDMAMNPTFPAAEVDVTRRLLATAVQNNRADAERLASEHLLATLWGAENPRGWPMSERTIEAIQRADLVAWHQRWFAPNNAVLVVAGDIDSKQIRAQIDRVFRFWQRRNVPAHASYPMPTWGGVRVRLIDKPDATQAYIRVGQVGIASTDPAYFDYVVLDHVLGGNSSSRLMKAMRGGQGVAFGASSYFDRGPLPGTAIMAASTRNTSVVETVQTLIRELFKLQSEGPGAAEVSDAISQISGRYASSLETAADIASTVLQAELTRPSNAAGKDDAVTFVREFPVRLAQVTTASAGRTAAARLDTKNLVIVIVASGKAVEPLLREANLPYEKIGYLEPIASWERNPELLARDPRAQAAGRTLLDQALAAKGGADRLGKVTRMTMTASGKIASGPQELPARLIRRYLAPDKLRLDIELDINGQTATVVTILRGDQAWHKQPQTGPIDLPADAVADLKEQLWRDQELMLLRARDPGTQVVLLGDRSREGVTFDALRVTAAGSKIPLDLYLDKKTHLPAFLIYRDDSGETVESYTTYKRIDGVAIAHHRETHSPQGNLLVDVTKVAFDEAMDDALFSRPQ